MDLVPLLKGEMKKRSTPIAFWDFPILVGQDSMPYIDPELQKGTTPLVKQMRGLYTRNFRNYHHPRITKGIYRFTGDHIGSLQASHRRRTNTGIELFDLMKDPAESDNFAASHSAIVKRLEEEIWDWQTSVLNSLMEAD